MSWVLRGPAQRFEPREWFAGPEVVELALAGDIGAIRYVEPRPLVCTAPRVTVRSGPDAAAEAVSELLFGETFEIVEVKAGFALGRSLHDRYIGWAPFEAFALPVTDPNHRISARRAPVFAAASIKAVVLHELPFAARVAGVMEGDFLALAGSGFVHRRHIEGAPASRFAAAALFADAPYLWGGRSPDGVDCSGLVQQALAAEGIALRRDTDLQVAMGEPVKFAAREAGDLVFWPGHVGLLLEDDLLCHANAHWMRVVTEPLANVMARLQDAEPAVRRFS
ncbi:C40 family peptidase [Sandarakinorhabdus limnophila]|uniref:C40 family peptidase n=1 Tax=Sandarakinorhabdus limnophila TaxID=210512 RepID=UPI0026ECC086|nr:NlpC/P60 family protein [Sandarakinorhabdus limnophila]MCM0032244.1 C40 family peptidase [Sandarakinorhabdus limnophila]